ncbi:TetR family transcriptional regulator [Propionigenium maris DSM 9537]|uniref:TetR family transcriptional regulator n=1 Tax=Propionigenium maris DSM 9537 TaxID=1123000 RepID=A0A9W6GQA9_9FUSO|nr:TetR/AcrR family transcriptional regulator [Propionigenium maris]GLI58137.1 TetR family transcriptional regulator [Propionigenium maris DSM 9537]
MQVKKEEVRKKILKAAIKEFKNSGYKNATMRKISNSSGIPIGNLYRYYQNKETLFNSIVADVYDELKDLFKRGMEKDEHTVEGRSLFFFNKLIDIYTANYDKTYILLHRNVGTKYENVQRELGNYFQDKITTNVRENNPNIEEEDLEFIRFICRLYLIGIGELITSYDKDIAKLKKMGRRFVTFYFQQIAERI